MKNIGEALWDHEDSMQLGGSTLRLRMTIVQLQDGGLWLHSPTKLTPQLKQAIDELGKVAYIVSAGNGHNIWLSTWQDAYPDAQLHISAGIPKKVQLKTHKILASSNDNPWQADLLQATMPSVPFFDESVFFHHKTKSLIVTDLIQNHEHGDDQSKPSKLSARFSQALFRFLGFKGKCVAPPLKMGFTRKDKAGFSAFIEQIKGWDFDKIIVTHGDIINVDAKQTFAQLCERFLVK